MSTAARDAHISRAASLFYSALKKQRTAFLKRTTAKLKKLYEASSPEVPRILPSLPPIALKPTISKLLTKAGTDGANHTNVMLGISPLQTTPQRVKDYIAEHSLEQIGADLDATTVSEIRTILETGLEAQTPFSKIITEIKQAGAFSRQRAQTIAVTEVGNAYSQGLLGQGKELQDEGLDMEKSWLAEDEPCDICAGNADEGWIDIDDDFSSGDDAPLAHPNCLCALLMRRAGSGE